MNAQPLTARLEPGLWVLPAGLALLAALLGTVAGANPAIAVAGAMAVGLLLLTLTSLIAGLVGFISLSFLELVPSLTGPALSLAKLAGLVLFVSWLAGMAAGRYRRLFMTEHPVLTFFMLTFVTWNVLSLVWAEEGEPVFISVASFALNFALFPILYAAVHRVKDVRWIVLAFIAGAAFTAIYGVIAQPNAASLATSSAAATGLNRLAGTIGDPNELASLLVVGVALSTAFLFNPKANPTVRLAVLAAALCMLLAVFLTLSRGGLVGLAAMGVIWIIVAGRRRLPAIAGALLVTTIAIGFFFGVASPEARERITASDGGSGRTDIWDVGWRMVEDKPLAGVGAGNFRVSSIHYLLAPGPIRFDEYFVDTPAVSHNMYLQVLSESGVVGLAMFLVIILGCIAAAVRALRAFRDRGDREGELLAAAVLMAIGSLLASYFFLAEEHSKHLWLLLSLGPAMLAVATRAGGRVRDDAN